MVKHDKLEFDKKMYEITLHMLHDNSYPKIPENVQFLMVSDEEDNVETGFYAEAFLYNGKVIISIQETNPKSGKDLNTDKQLVIKEVSQQYYPAKKFYEQVLVLCKARNINPENIVFTGYSLGGSLTQIMCSITGLEGVAFAPYGTQLIIENDLIINVDNIPNKKEIRNYGHVDDPIYMINIDNQVGTTYVLDLGQNIFNNGLKFMHRIQYLKDFELANIYIPKKKGNLNKNFQKPKSKSSNKIQHTFVFEKAIKPTFQLIYNGYDVTNEFLPFIKSIMYIDFLEDECDELKIELNVTDDKLLNSWYPDKGGVLECFFKMGNQILKCGKFTISSNNLVSTPFGDFLKISALAIPLNLALRTIRTDYYEKRCTRT